MTNYEKNSEVSCPACGTFVKLLDPSLKSYGSPLNQFSIIKFGNDEGYLSFAQCPKCSKTIIELKTGSCIRLVNPQAIARKPVHPDVPTHVANDFTEACLVLSLSPKASAALARRCLQSLLVEQGATKRNLIDQIDEILPMMPSYIGQFVDNIRELGNLSAHTKQDRNTSEILDVEPGEAEWIIELLEGLFDHFYAKPAQMKEREAGLIAKLANAQRHKAASVGND